MRETLYQHVEVLDADEMAAFGDREERRAGHLLYEKEKFGSLEWLTPAQHLRCRCDKRVVELANRDGKLVGACACGATLDSGACRHLFTVLFAICNVLDDSQFRVLFRNNKFRDHFKQVYGSGQGEVRNPAPRGEHPELRLYMDDNGFFRIRLPSPWYEKLRNQETPEKDPLYRLTHLQDRGPEGQRALIKYLDSAGEGAVPLSLHLPSRSYDRLHWESTNPVHVTNVIEVTSGGRVKAYHEFSGAASPDDRRAVMPLPPHLVLDSTGWALGPMKDFLDLDEILLGAVDQMALATEEDISVDGFNAGWIAVLGANRDEALAGLALRDAGGGTGSTPVAAQLRVDLLQDDDDDSYLYKPVSVVDGEALGGVASHMGDCLRPFYSPPRKLASSARRRDLWRLFDAILLEDDEEAALAAREVILKNGAIPEEEYDGARRLLEDFREDVLRTHRYVLRVKDGAWQDYQVPHRAIGFALAVGRQVLQGSVVEGRREPVLRVSAAQLRNRLNTLLCALQAGDIELHLDHRPVRRVRLEIEIAPRAADALDWFELHPLVRFEGRELSREEWERVLSGGGAVESADGLALVAQDDLDVLQRLRDHVRGLAPDDAAGDTVCIRRLQILEWLDMEKNGVRLDLESELRDLLDRVRAFDRMDPVAPPARLQTTMRDYQHRGYEWLAFLYRHRFGACLADDMGLGKTIQAIALLAGIREGVVAPQSQAVRALPHLVVVPATLVFNWQEELHRFYPDLRVMAYVGSGRAAAFEDCDVAITTYGTLARDIDQLQDMAFHVVVFDEAQALKNVHAARTAAARKINAAFTLCLTGTPLENHIGEFFSIIDLALPGLMGTYHRFMREQGDGGLATARERTRPFVLRRTKDAIGSELPPIVEQSIKLDLSDVQRECYTRTVEQVRGTVDEAFEQKTGAQAGMVALTALLRLRQICVSPVLAGMDDPGPSPKIGFLLQHLEELREEGHAALVFSQFTRCLDLIEEAMDDQGMDRLRMDGSTPTTRRKDLVTRFQSGDGPSVFLLSLKTGGTGLNLTRASYVLHLDPWWNPAAERQATDRAHRLGQARTVFTTRLIMRHTVEEKMETLKRRKEEIFRAVLAGTGERSRTGAITREDFSYLIGDEETVARAE